MRPVAFTCSQLTLLIIHPRRGRMAFVLGNSKCHGLSRQPYRVLFSTWALPAQPCAQFGKRQKRVTCQPDEVLFSTWALPSQPYSRHEKRRCRSRAHRSTITRLPSGASVSRSTSFSSGAFGVGAGTAHPCTGALAALRRIPAPPEPFLSA